MDIDLVDGTRMALSLALDAAGLRQQAIAANIANAGTPGYARLRVNFEEQLRAFQSAIGGTEAAARGTLAGVAPRLVIDAAGAAAGTGLDHDIVELNRNVIQYQALLHGLSRRYALIGAAIGEGRRA